MLPTGSFARCLDSLRVALCVVASLWGGTSLAAGVCEGISGNAETARAKMVNEVVGNPVRRAALMGELQQGQGGICRQVLESLVTTILSHQDNPSDKGRAGLLILALRGRIPRVNEVLQMEIRESRGEDLLSTLREADAGLYRETLLAWVLGVAVAIRSSQDLGVEGANQYGAHGLREEDAQREKVRLASPLVFERALRLVRESKERLSKSEVSSLSVIFAASTAAYRQAFLRDVAEVVGRHMDLWIPEFRTEPVWVQARLFPLMAAVGGPEVVRELLWLSKNHADLRIRGLAEHSLDKLLQGKVK